jgi:hypothetical protein
MQRHELAMLHSRAIQALDAKVAFLPNCIYFAAASLDMTY